MILSGQRETVAQWVQSRVRDMPVFQSDAYEALGVVDANDNLLGGVVYTHYSRLPDNTYDIHMSAAGKPGWLTKVTLRVLFSYPFTQLRCSRVTTIAAKANKRARELNARLGFVHEGTLRGAFGTNRDGILFGMLRQECRWLR